MSAPSVNVRCIGSVASLWLVLASAAPAQEVGGPAEPEPLRRLEQAEARLQALEELVRRQSEQLAETQHRLDALAQPGAATVGQEALQAALNGEAGLAPAVAEAPRAAGSERPTAAAHGFGNAMPTAPAQAAPERPVAAPALTPFTLNSLVQVWYSAGNQGSHDTFRVRRAELYFNGEVTTKARWQVLLDPAKALGLETTSATAGGTSLLTGVSVNQASRILQNAYVSLDYVPKVHLNVGQFKLPLSLEGQQSSGKLETVERALFLSDRARGGNYGDVRDIGLLAKGGIGPHVDFQAGVYNGVAESQNDLDRNDPKALAGSLSARPSKGLQVGSSGVWGNGGGDRPRRNRLGFDLLYTPGALMLKAELMAGHDGPLARRGYYGHVGYRFTPRVEGVFRVDSWDPDTARESAPDDVEERDYVAGFNLYLREHNLKLQANYLRKTFPSGIVSSRNVVMVNTQAFW